MDAKSARQLIDEVCREADRSVRGRPRSATGQFLRLAGFGLVLGMGAAVSAAGCDATSDPDAMISSGNDAYGIVSDAGVDALPPGADAYGILMDSGLDAD